MDKQDKYTLGFIMIWGAAAAFTVAFWAAVFILILKLIAWL
jgi:hypothetical protein